MLGLGKKDRCKKRCNAQFPLEVELRDGCRAWCQTNNTSFIDGFLTTINEASVIRRYGYDPQPDSGISVEQYADPLNQRELQELQLVQRQETFTRILWIGGGLLALALIVFLFVKRK